MLSTLHSIASYLIVVLGCVHELFTFHNYDHLDLDAVWFLGAGLAIVYTGLLNIVVLRARARDRISLALCLLPNLIMLAGFAAGLALLRQPQVFIGILLSAITTAGTLQLLFRRA